MDLKRGKKVPGETSSSTTQLANESDNDSTSVEDLKLETITPSESPTPYIVVKKDFPSWITQEGNHNLAFESDNSFLKLNNDRRSGHSHNLNHLHSNMGNGDIIKSFGDHRLDNGTQNPKHLINQLGLLNYHKPGLSIFNSCSTFTSLVTYFFYKTT